jgi:hypothetical protein
MKKKNCSKKQKRTSEAAGGRSPPALSAGKDIIANGTKIKKSTGGIPQVQDNCTSVFIRNLGRIVL